MGKAKFLKSVSFKSEFPHGETCLSKAFQWVKLLTLTSLALFPIPTSCFQFNNFNSIQWNTRGGCRNKNWCWERRRDGSCCQGCKSILPLMGQKCDMHQPCIVHQGLLIINTFMLHIVTHCYTWEVLACVGNQVPSFNYNGKYNHVLTSQLYTLDKGAMTGLVVFDLIWLECNRKGMIIKKKPESIYLSKRVKACVTIGFVCTIYMQVSRCAYGYVHMFHHHYIGAVTK